MQYTVEREYGALVEGADSGERENWMRTCTSATCLQRMSNGPFRAKIWAAAVGGLRLTVWATVGRIFRHYVTCWISGDFTVQFVLTLGRNNMRYIFNRVCVWRTALCWAAADVKNNSVCDVQHCVEQQQM